jgi:hypothetical protein
MDFTIFQGMYDATFIAMLLCFSLGLLLSDEKTYVSGWKSLLFSFLKVLGTFGVFTLMAFLTTLLPVPKSNRALLPMLLSFASLLVAALYFFVFLRDRKKLVFAIKLMIFLSTMMVVIRINQNLGKAVGFATKNQGWIYFARIVPYPIVVLMGFFEHHFNIAKFAVISKTIASLLLLISLLIIGSTFFQDFVLTTDDYPLLYVFFLVLFIVLLGILSFSYYALFALTESENKNIELQAQATLTSSEKMMITLSEKNKNDIRSIKHDLKNQYASMEMLLKDKKYDELEKYFASLNELNSPVFHFVDCGNAAVSAILNLEQSKAEVQHIKITYNVVVPPLLPFNEAELSSVISNILDNAMEACIRDKAVNPEISFSLVLYRNYLRISCQNPTLQKSLSLETDKKEAGHGYGTKIIHNIAEKYNGVVDYKIEQGFFKTYVLLEINEKNKEESPRC